MPPCQMLKGGRDGLERPAALDLGRARLVSDRSEDLADLGQHSRERSRALADDLADHARWLGQQGRPERFQHGLEEERTLLFVASSLEYLPARRNGHAH